MDVLFSIVLYIVNIEYGAWGSHFITVFMLEEIEAVALLFFYRKMYFKQVGVSWQSLGYSKHIRDFSRATHKYSKTKLPDKLAKRFYHQP